MPVRCLVYIDLISGLPTEEVKARLDHQMSKEVKTQKAKVVIENNTNLNELYKRIDLLLERI